jgi:hypothetical protein
MLEPNLVELVVLNSVEMLLSKHENVRLAPKHSSLYFHKPGFP